MHPLRLNDHQKLAVLMARPDNAQLVRAGAGWGVVWFEKELPPRERWRSQLVTRVDPQGRPWGRPEAGGKTRREAVQKLLAEAAL